MIFKERHDFVYQRLSAMDGINPFPCHGTFYSFPEVKGAMKKVGNMKNDVQFAEYLLDKAEIAMVPGSAFGAPGYMRLSYATSMENLEQAMDRLEKTLK